MTRHFNIKIINNFTDFKKLHYVWAATLEQSKSDKVFMTHEWFSAWWRAFGHGKELFIILVHADANVVGIAPLMRCKTTFRGLPVNSIKFIENHDSPACGFIIVDRIREVTEAIMNYLLNEAKGWDMIFFKNTFYDEIYNSMVYSTDYTNKKNIKADGLTSPYIRINTDWNTYSKNLSSKSRKTIRNIGNRIKRLGDVQIKCNNIVNFEDIVSVSRKGWKYKKGKSFINSRERDNFFKVFSEIAQNNGWISFFCLYVKDEPIAYEYHVKYKEIDTALLSEFDRDYESFSPGAFLDFEIVKSLFENGFNEYDMCGSFDGYKQKWTKDVRQYKNLIIFNDSVYSKLLYSLEEKPIKFFRSVRNRILTFKKLTPGDDHRRNK